MLTTIVSVCLVAACNDSSVEDTPVAGRWYSAEQVVAGDTLYQTYCASCHASDGSATDDWRTPLPDGNYPPPPLNGSAHTWHHPLDMLDQTIAVGGAQYGGVMPGFDAALDRGERLAIIAWFQNLWSDEVYLKWDQINARSKE